MTLALIIVVSGTIITAALALGWFGATHWLKRIPIILKHSLHA
jgi:hypothetical protein